MNRRLFAVLFALALTASTASAQSCGNADTPCVIDSGTHLINSFIRITDFSVRCLIGDQETRSITGPNQRGGGNELTFKKFSVDAHRGHLLDLADAALPLAAFLGAVTHQNHRSSNFCFATNVDAFRRSPDLHCEHQLARDELPPRANLVTISSNPSLNYVLIKQYLATCRVGICAARAGIDQRRDGRNSGKPVGATRNLFLQLG